MVCSIFRSVYRLRCIWRELSRESRSSLREGAWCVYPSVFPGDVSLTIPPPLMLSYQTLLFSVTSEARSSTRGTPDLNASEMLRFPSPPDSSLLSFRASSPSHPFARSSVLSLTSFSAPRFIPSFVPNPSLRRHEPLPPPSLHSFSLSTPSPSRKAAF